MSCKISDTKFSELQRRCNVFFRGKAGLFPDVERLPNRDAVRVTIRSGLGPFDEFDDDVIEEFIEKLQEDPHLEIMAINKPRRDLRIFYLRPLTPQ